MGASAVESVELVAYQLKEYLTLGANSGKKIEV